MATTLQKEFQWFLSNRQELLEKYSGRYVVIMKDKVVGDYGTLDDAYTESKKKFELGNFLIQLVAPDEDSFTQTFHSRVAF